MKSKEHPPIDEFLSVGEISKRSGVAISALHFYEEKGLIKPFRNKQNQRRYPKGILRIISLIKVAQTLGFPLDQIQTMLKSIPKSKRPTDDNWETLSQEWRKILNAKIQAMIFLRDQLDKCIGCGCLSLKDCPLRNKDDKLAKKGPGAYFLKNKI